MLKTVAYAGVKTSVSARSRDDPSATPVALRGGAADGAALLAQPRASSA
jgi:hypothetical protein